MQLGVDSTWTEETLRENEFVNKIRERVTAWRDEGYLGVTKVTRTLLEHWKREERERRFFFCQIEALETLIYVTEVAEKRGDQWIINQLQDANTDANPGLYRIALKMATGTGKTVLMSMIIAWQSINKAHYRQDTRFTDSFAVIAPGITIKDRLAVLQPGNPQNYYKALDVVPNQYQEMLNTANIVITNFHSLDLRTNERYKGAKVVREEVRNESPAAMINRVFKPLKNKKNILVLNDEAHHCYRRKEANNKLTGDERKEADINNDEARVWITGIEYLNQKVGVSAVIDLSATPFFLKGSGYDEGTLFPWVVSDFSLIDAIEAGIVKVPRVPVADDAINQDDMPNYRNLWVNIRDDLPKKNRNNEDLSGDPQLPQKLETAIYSLYGNYEKHYKKYEEAKKTNPNVMPPVMIVVCGNTSVSELIYRFISGYEKEVRGEKVMVPGALPIFRNEDGQQFIERPNSLIIDSMQIDSGGAVDQNFKNTFAREIEEFRQDYQQMYPGRTEVNDEDILREVMNTVGKKDKLGENIKCVISVSMLTEGWDANTVTHILGVRAFSTQLLCEQVVGRGLRRVSFAVDEEDKFTPEYAEVYGVPFSFIPTAGSTEPPEPKEIHWVKSLKERAHYKITFPRLEGYRYELTEETLTAQFDDSVNTTIENIPIKVQVSGLVGETEEHTLEHLENLRQQQVVFNIASHILEKYHVDADDNPRFWLFPQIKRIVEEYIANHVQLKDNMVIGFLHLTGNFNDAVSKIQNAIVKGSADKMVVPILMRYNSLGSTEFVEFPTTKPVVDTAKSHINYVVADTEEWEQGVAKKLEQMDEVEAYVKNQGLDFYIPYHYRGMTRSYMPDFIARLKNPDGTTTNLIIEVTGKKDDKKSVKVDVARSLWVPAVNNAQDFGHWEFLEIQDIHETQNLIRLGMKDGFNSLIESK